MLDIREGSGTLGEIDTLELLERLIKRVDGVKEKMDYERAMNRVKLSLLKGIPAIPRRVKSLRGSLYDTYNCGRCGSIVTSAGAEYCWQCGQKIARAYLGRRVEKPEEQRGLCWKWSDDRSRYLFYLDGKPLEQVSADVIQRAEAEKASKPGIKVEDFV